MAKSAGNITKITLAAGDPRRGPFLVVHNARVIHARKGWTNAEAMEAVADARKGILYQSAGA